jgi:hypothetical protein
VRPCSRKCCDAGAPAVRGSATEDGRCAAARRRRLRVVENVSQPLNSTDTTERTLACFVLRWHRTTGVLRCEEGDQFGVGVGLGGLGTGHGAAKGCEGTIGHAGEVQREATNVVAGVAIAQVDDRIGEPVGPKARGDGVAVATGRPDPVQLAAGEQDRAPDALDRDDRPRLPGWVGLSELGRADGWERAAIERPGRLAGVGPARIHHRAGNAGDDPVDQPREVGAEQEGGFTAPRHPTDQDMAVIHPGLGA